MAKKTAKKKIKKKPTKKSTKKVFVKKKKKKKKKAKSSTTKNRQQQRGSNDSGPSSEAHSRPGRGRAQGSLDVLREYQFKKGTSGNPKGRAKGSVSITSRIKNLLTLPVRFPGKKDIRQDYTYADLLAEMAVKAANNQDFRFFKEIWERVDGKVPDHVVVESTKRLVAQEAATLAQDLLGLVGEVVDEYLDDDRAEAFMGSLAQRFETKFIDEPAAESEELKEFLSGRGDS